MIAGVFEAQFGFGSNPSLAGISVIFYHTCLHPGHCIFIVICINGSEDFKIV